MNFIKSFFQEISLYNITGKFIAYLVSYGFRVLGGLLVFSPIMLSFIQLFTPLLPAVYPPETVNGILEGFLAAVLIWSFIEIAVLGMFFLFSLGHYIKKVIWWADKKIK